MLLAFRALQAAGGAAGVLAAFDLLDPGDAEGKEERHLWIAAAVFGTAAGPGVGGLLTQAFDWRSIFIIQVPIGIVGAIACLQINIPQPTHHSTPFKWRPLVSIGLLAGGLAAVLFTLVLQLVASCCSCCSGRVAFNACTHHLYTASLAVGGCEKLASLAVSVITVELKATDPRELGSEL
jgi:MFS family permease